MADNNVRTYDPKQVIATFGPVILSGYMSGTFITVTRNGDLFEKDKGADGSVDRINRNANDFRISVMLKQTSNINDALSLIVAADIRSNTGKLPFIIKDLQGTTLFVAPQAWIAADPNDEYSDALTGREWQFDTGAAVKFTGGNLE